ncbi:MULTISPECIES: TonB-dependent siderophore receptor [unclassified Herbaspirillum]|uniref:TonB-dependent receptor n=1 Tax=unclassified Herbaspirillum TaxID=2624150 RepID=UPI0011547FE5|nr:MULTISPECIES: TonB-dependent siderophore receptor [unclassified Herbaspirillum]MBB5392764.1 catecholate siderophore receptor [Herbaspirillum sp. SJZ102]TQJ99065.1 catecholate siderophore receptor [Herbaspirillum sp. SJZ130]TQK04077.1 catecholate siderophore receptor [Herbaspirillum sp. SJZ106]
MKSRLKPGRLAVLAALSACSAPGFAQTTDSLPQVQVSGSRTNDSYVAPTAVSGTKSEAPLRDIPQTINVVPAQVIKDQNATSLQDVLKNVPGLGMSTGDGQRDQVFIRGFTAIGDQFVDGFRDDALYFRDLSNVETLEVIKGPAAVLYGRGSSGGLINRMTKKPGVDVSDVSVTANSTAGRRAELDLGRGASDNGVLSWRLTGAVERGDSYRAQQFIDRTAIAPSMELRFSADTKLLLQADYLEDRRLTDFGIPSYHGRPVSVDPGTYYGAANARDADFSQSRVMSTTATFTHRFNDEFSFRNGFRYYDYHLNRNNTNISGNVNEAAGTMNMSHAKLVRDENGWFNQSELTQKLKLGSTKHEILYGVEFGSQSKDAYSYNGVPVAGTGSGLPPVSIFNPVLPVVNPNTLGALTTTYGTYDTFGTYLQDSIALNEQWKALVGLRYDSFKQKSRIVGGTAPGNLSRTDNAYSPRAGLVWQPTETQSYYLSWSRSFQPSAELLPLAVTNANLAPEVTRNTEAGAKYDFLDGRASATVSVFRLERDNIKATDPTNNNVVPVGKQRTDGMEFTLSADLKGGWKVMAGYAYLDAVVTDSIAVDRSVNGTGDVPFKGKNATLTPKHSANLWLTKDLGSGFTVGGGANAVGARFANPGNTVTLPGYVTADAMAAYRTAKYDIQLNIGNIFNTGYIVSGHGTSPNLSLPGAPRNVALTLRYHM